MASLQIYLRDEISNNKNEHPIYIRITADQKSRYCSLDIWIKKNHWNPKKQEVRKTQNKDDASAIYNQVIAEMRAAFKRAVQNHQAKNMINKLRNKPNEKLTAEKIKTIIFSEEDSLSGKRYIKYARSENKKIKEQERYNTFKHKRTALNKFEEYLKTRSDISGSDLLFTEITVGLLKDYHTYLTEEVGNKQNTANKDIVELGTFFSYAIEDEFVPLQVNPFSAVKFDWKKSKKVFLTSKELNKIIKLPLKKGSLIWHVRNYFFFQIYTAGLRVSDLCVVKWDAIMGDRFEYTMRKTKRHKSLLLVEPAKIILNQYGPPEPGKSIFSILNQEPDQFKNDINLDIEIGRKTALLNQYLKKIEEKAELDKHISTHIGRHTFANMALDQNWSKEQIQKALAHSSIRTTEKYLASFEDYNLDSHLKDLFSGSNWMDDMTSAA